MASSGRRNARENSKAGFEKREKRRQIRSLQEAIDKHDEIGVKDILEDDFDVDFQYRSQTALQLAVKEGCLEICRLLIAKGANVNMADAEQNTVLNMACLKGYSGIAEFLVENGANIDEQNVYGYSALHTCAVQGNADLMQYLISAHGDPDSSLPTGQTALHTAVKLQKLEIVQLLLLGECNVDKKEEHRRTPLMFAAECGFSDITQILINGGANVNCQDNTGSTALLIAVRHGHLNVVRELVNAGADINLPSTKGVTPFLESVLTSYIHISLYLIEQHCDVNKADRLKQAPIHCAVSKVSQFFNEETDQAMLLIRRLVEVGCDLNAPNQDGARPLYQSASGGNYELTQFLLTGDVDLTVMTTSGSSLLHAGVLGNSPLVVDLLINAGCTLNERNSSGEHPLLTAILCRSDFKIIESLVKAGSNLDIRDKAGGNAALHNAIRHVYPAAALLLIEHGCDINAPNSQRKTPLYLACEKNNIEVVRKILECPRFNRSMLKLHNIPQPLFAAVKNNHVHLTDILINFGCDINMVNIDGLSPIQVALHENCPFISKLLLKYNCNLDAHAKVTRLFKCCLEHDDQHPHFDLEPLFLALTHKSVEMLKLIIKCYWHLPWKNIRMLDEVFGSTPDMNTHYSQELQQEILEVFRAGTGHPRSLQESCRAVVRECLSACPEESVTKLPVATKLKDYIMMEEIFGDLQDIIEKHYKKHPKDFKDFASHTGNES